MNARTPVLQSRLPNVGTTIFTVMSALAQQHGAVNLGQGFPDFECDPKLLDAVDAAMRAGHNQYPPMTGVPALREAVSAKIQTLYGARYDAGSEITITAGATQAILTAVLAIVHPGDEVIVLEPCYDSYAPNIELAGGRVVRVPLAASTFRPDFDAIAAAMTPRTRALIVNSPHNPSATVWTGDEMQRLAALLDPTDIVLISDEVYEHMVYDGARHVSASSFPALASRSFVVSSFGKTFHVTGWKVGTVAAPAALTAVSRLAGLLPGQARPVPRRAVEHATAAAARRGHVLPMRRLRGCQLAGRGGVLPLVDAGGGRGGDPAVGLLRRRPRSAHRPPVFRQA
jgi:methionine aminotransferase